MERVGIRCGRVPGLPGYYAKNLQGKCPPPLTQKAVYVTRRQGLENTIITSRGGQLFPAPRRIIKTRTGHPP